MPFSTSTSSTVPLNSLNGPSLIVTTSPTSNPKLILASSASSPRIIASASSGDSGIGRRTPSRSSSMDMKLIIPGVVRNTSSARAFPVFFFSDSCVASRESDINLCDCGIIICTNRYPPYFVSCSVFCSPFSVILTTVCFGTTTSKMKSSTPSVTTRCFRFSQALSSRPEYVCTTYQRASPFGSFFSTVVSVVITQVPAKNENNREKPQSNSPRNAPMAADSTITNNVNRTVS